MAVSLWPLDDRGVTAVTADIILGQALPTPGYERFFKKRKSAHAASFSLAAALAGSTSTKAASARRARAKNLYNEQMNAYWARHCYFDI